MPISGSIQERILVTGGAGFIGSCLVDALLEKGYNVVCLDNFSTGKEENLADAGKISRFCLIRGDIREIDTCREAVKGVTVVFHQAALGSVPRSVHDPLSTHHVNTGGFLNMLVASRDEGIRRFIYASSSSVYGDHPGLPKTEELTGRPMSPYALTKLAGEHYARLFAELYGMECIGLRYFNVFGMRQDPAGPYAAVIPKFIHSLLRNQPPVIYGDGLQTRDFTYVKNVIRANLLAAEVNTPDAINQVYNVACGSRISLLEIYSILGKELERFVPGIKNIQPEFSGPRPGDVKHSLASIEKTTRLLGYEPAYDFTSGISEAVEWYYNHLKPSAS